MGYSLDPTDASLAAALRRIACEEAARARAEIADAGLSTERKVHEARKRTKRLRGMLRLVRAAFPDFAAENAHLRDAARGLSALRDRDVMIATHDRLMARAQADRRRLAPLRAHLTRARTRVAAAQDPDAALARYGAEIAALPARAARWRLAGKDRAVLEAGLAATWKKARAAMARAKTGDDIEDFHEWRKRVKDHWYQARLLTPLDPGPIGAQAEAAGVLGEILGDLHDLDVYRLHLAGPEATGLDRDRRAEASALATARIADLERAALRAGKRLFKPAPQDLAQAWGAAWKARSKPRA